MSDAEFSEETQARVLLSTPLIEIRDIRCRGSCRHRSPAECVQSTHLVFPYRGVFVRHIGTRQYVADPNQLAFFNADEEYAISHPAEGGDACLSVVLDPSCLDELTPRAMRGTGERNTLPLQQRPIGGIVQRQMAQLRHGLANGNLTPLEAETHAFSAIAAALHDDPVAAADTGRAQSKIADRARIALASSPERRWSLSEIAREVGVSPVYLAQVFAKESGTSTYRYHLRLRLSRALERIPDCRNLTELGLDLGFSSHSHFSASFRRAFGCTPREFRMRSTRVGSSPISETC